MKSITLPVLLVSGGNRRKRAEHDAQNYWIRFRGSRAGQRFVDAGFPSAQYFNELALIESPRSTNLFERFYGLQSKTNDGTDRDYGTSIPLTKTRSCTGWQMSPSCKSGEKLSHDQGYPARIIILVMWEEDPSSG